MLDEARPSVDDRVRRRVDATAWWVVGVASLAFAVRLTTLVRGPGLYGRLGYDGGVYYAAGSALAHGVLPYRDLLLLHPPGIALELLPFAALGTLVGDADAYAAARVAWCLLGAVSTALVFVVVRSRGLGPALAAATFYALFVPAVVGEDNTTLEAIGSVCLLGALALLVRQWDGRRAATAGLVVAGALLGLSTATKIWGVVVVVVVVAWTWRRLGLRRAGLVLGGAVGVTVVVCLPFFAAAPATMWRMVVFDQIGRRRVSEPLTGRITDTLGLSVLRDHAGTGLLAAVGLVLLLAVVVLAVRDPLGRFAALLFAVTFALLMWTPPWSLQYTPLSAPAAALLVGAAVSVLLGLGARLRRPVAVGVGVLLAAYAAVSLPGLPTGNHFPGDKLEAVLVKNPGCVVTDDPILLIETGALQRNYALGCPVVVDMSGYSWDLQPSATQQMSRQKNKQWNAVALQHFQSGDVAVVVRFRTLAGLSDETKQEVASWPLLAKVSGLEVRRPEPKGVSPFPAPR
jgi:alpha-1,2-mannosyltransferase